MARVNLNLDPGKNANYVTIIKNGGGERIPRKKFTGACIFRKNLYNRKGNSGGLQTAASRRKSRMQMRMVLGGFAWVLLAALLILVNAMGAGSQEALAQTESTAAESRSA